VIARTRRRYLAADIFVMAWCAFMAVSFALLGMLGWALINLACFAVAGIDGCHQAKRLREGEWSRWRVR
jgi:hypothetical protein